MAVVIATCGRPDSLERTLESLAAANRPPALTEVIVAENGGAQGAAAVVKRLSDRLPVRHILRDEGNKSGALNAALDACTCDFVYFMDDDVRIAPEAVETYSEAAARYGPGHHFSGPLVAEWEVEPPDWLKRYLPGSARGWDEGDEEIYYDRPYFIGSNWAAFRSDVLAAGGFDERIGPGSPTGAIGDEMELQRRLLDAGGRGVYLPGARVWHDVPANRCDFPWAVGRRRLEGRTYGVLGWPMLDGLAPSGVRGRLDLAVLDVKVWIARRLGWTDERRAWLETTRARTRGYLEGRKVRRRHFP